jgi:hypothetical protein
VKRKSFSKQAKRSKSFHIFFVLTALVFFSACQKTIIDEDKLVRIYIENNIVEESQPPNSDTYRKQKTDILKKYNITQKDFDEAMLDMKDDKEKWNSFFKKANVLVDDLKKSGTIK